MILVLLLMAAGVLWTVGAQGLAKKLITIVLVILLAMAALPCLLGALGVSLDRHVPSGPSSDLGWWVLGLAPVALLGFARWRRRERSKKTIEAWRKKNLHPRQRALPPPPEETA